MPTSSGTVFYDANVNGVLDPGEFGIAGRLVQLWTTATGGGLLIASTTTDASGNYSFDMTGLTDPQYVLKCNPPNGWSATSPQNLLIPSSGGSGYNFGQIGVICTRVVSSWLRKVCFSPGQGVIITFRQRRHGVFTCVYPGTTYADYTTLINAPSKGRWVDKFWRHKQYIPLPPSP
jgi:hypothetical protein